MQFSSPLQYISFTLAATVPLIHASSKAPYTISQGTGLYGVTYRNFELIDHSRRDPWHTNSSRHLALTRFDPIPKWQCPERKKIPYMTQLVADVLQSTQIPPGALPDNFFREFELEICPGAPEPLSPSSFPMAVFGQGAGGVRFAYSALMQEIASHGYTIFNVDFPGDSAVVEYADGEKYYAVDFDTDNYTNAEVQEVQAQDFSFVLDKLGFEPKKKYNQGSCIGERRAVAFGHSFGGATSANALVNDARFAGGVDFDGSIYGDIANTSLGHPNHNQTFLLWTSGEDLGGESFDYFSAAQDKSKGSDFLGTLNLINSSHYGLASDAAILVDTAGIRDQLNEVGQAIAGGVSAETLRKTYGFYLPNLFDLALGRGGDRSIFKRPPPGYGNVAVVGQ